MSEAEIDRIRKDIATIREAAGLELPFGWEDVWLSLAAVPCGIVLSTVGALCPLRYAWLGLVLALGMVIAVVGLRFRFRRSTGRSPVRRREYGLGLGAALIYGLLAGVYLAWGRYSGEPTRITGGVAVSMTGGLCAVMGMTGAGRRSCFAAAAALMAYGLVLPLCSPRQVLVAGGATMAVIGLGTAAIQAWQLRHFEGDHEPATD